MKSTQELVDIQRQYDTGTYCRRELVIVRGEGARVEDSEGRVYIDCVAGMGVMNVGHSHPAVVQAVQEQAGRLMICSNLFITETGTAALEKLVAAAPDSISTGFFSNSGTESVEAALKFARFSSGKPRFICAQNGFHGRTLGALSATWKPAHREGFGPLLKEFDFVPFNDFEKLEAAVTPDTAGILLEVVQGEGGVRIGARDYFSRVQELCRSSGILLIIDEVQTGFCRTGKMFACDHFDLQPDLLCAAKAAAGGIPMGVTLCSDAITITPGTHGSTFGGNPLAAAAALAALDVMEKEGLAAAAAAKGDLLAGLIGETGSPAIREVRHLGLMIGVEFNEPAAPLIRRLQDEGVLAFGAGEQVMRLLPPLVISEEDIRAVPAALKRVLA